MVWFEKFGQRWTNCDTFSAVSSVQIVKYRSTFPVWLEELWHFDWWLYFRRLQLYDCRRRIYLLLYLKQKGMFSCGMFVRYLFPFMLWWIRVIFMTCIHCCFGRKSLRHWVWAESCKCHGMASVPCSASIFNKMRVSRRSPWTPTSDKTTAVEAMFMSQPSKPRSTTSAQCMPTPVTPSRSTLLSAQQQALFKQLLSDGSA